MERKTPALLATLVLACFSSVTLKSAEVLTPCFLKVSLYTNIAGTAVANLTSDPRYPANPSEVRFLKSFNSRDALPNDALENFGGRIEGFITPLTSGQYYFFLRSDDSSELWLSTDETEASAVLIAQETDCCDLFAEPGVDPATSLPISLTAGQRYFIKVLYKSSTSTDVAQVAWREAGDTTPAASLKPIAGTYLSTLASDAQVPSVTITRHPPSSVTAAEDSEVTLTVNATTTPTNLVCIQWQRNGLNIPGAMGTNYSFYVRKTDEAASYRAVVAVPGASALSSEAILSVTPDDSTPPVLVSAKGGPNRPEVVLTFSEPVDPGTATAAGNYSIASPGGQLAVTEAVLLQDQTQVLLKTDPQTPGTVYTVQVINVTDQAVAPNLLGLPSEATFAARGPWLQGEDGFVVFEAEDYDRNRDGLWLPDTTRGTPSGGISMVNPNGLGGSLANTRLEYDILFTQTGTNIVWFRTAGNDGNDDSGWLYLDGQLPPNRTTGNQAVMSTGSGLTADFAWRSTPFEGGGQMTIIIETPGMHTIGLVRREDGAFFDKFLITTDPTFNPATFGPLGPQVTLRQGDPPQPGASLDITTQPTNVVTVEHSTVTLRSAVTVPPGSLVGYQWQRKVVDTFVDIPGVTTTAFTINRIGLDWDGALVRMRASGSGITKFTDEALITVNPDTTPPELLGASGLAVPQQVILRFSEPLEANTIQDTFNYSILGPEGPLAVAAVTLLPNQRTLILDTGPQTIGNQYTVTVTGVADQAATSNVIVSAVAKFYSLGVLREQGPDGLIVFEAENFDRNTDNRWIKDSAWGNPSGSLSVVLPNGGGGNENSKLEYDLMFTQTGTHYVWYRASGPSGTDDSAWLHLDGTRPPNRAAANQASMQAVNGTDFVWATDPQDGEPPYTIEITTAGLHTIGLALREDGTYFDKFAITTDTNFNPLAFGPFGPGETRVGAPPSATLTLSSPASNATFTAGATVPLTVAIADNGRVVSKVEYFTRSVKIGEATATPFTFDWQNVPEGVYVLSAQLTDDVGDMARSDTVVITVGNPNDVLILVGNPDLSAAPADAAIRDRIAALGFNVIVMDDDFSTDIDGFGKKLIVVSSTVTSGSIATKFRNASSPVLLWEQANQDDFGMTGDTVTDHGTTSAQTQIEILNTTHPLAAGFGPGPMTIATAPTDVSWGAPNDNAARIATAVGNTNQVVLYGYDTGASMAGGFAAPARRVSLFLTDGTYVLLNQDGQKLFDAALDWALGGLTPPSIALAASQGPGGLKLQWTGGAGPYKVQKKTTLSDAVWVDVTTTSQTSHTVPIDGQSGFFRVTQD